jgi:opacity protein-like surface antigen
VPLFRGLNLEGHYFGVRAEPEHEENGEHGAERRSGVVDLGTINGSYSFRLGGHVTLLLGFGVFFGEGQKSSPAFTFRWEIEKGRLFSQGLFIQSLQESEEFGRVSVWDGNHVSVRLSRFEFGPSWERIHTRAENEWKGGGRAAFRILPNMSIVFFVLAPKTEYRGGIIIHPER